MVSIDVVNGKPVDSTTGFTNDQKKAYLELIEFINSDFNDKDYKRALIGPAGTGKTYLVRSLINNCKISYSKIGLSAPTHKAARVLKESIGLSSVSINTLASDLGLRVNYENSNFDLDNVPFDPKGKIKVGNYYIYIVDEASMINNSHRRLLEKIAKASETKIIYIGDASQLPPVNESISTALHGIKTCELKQIVRQGDNNPISHLLQLLRDDIKNRTYNFLNYIHYNRIKYNDEYTKGYEVLNTNDFVDKINLVFTDEEYTKNVDLYKIIGYTNDAVNYYNGLIRNTIVKDSHKAVITKHDLILSYTTIVDEFMNPIIRNSEEYIIKDIVNYVHPTYDFKGFLVRFTAIHGGQSTQPIFIVDHNDTKSLYSYYRTYFDLYNSAKNAPLSSRASKWVKFFNFRDNCFIITNIKDSNDPTKILVSRNIDYGFSITAHKSQGSTYDTVLVDVNNIIYDSKGKLYTNTEMINRLLYTACSRAKNKLYLRYG